MYLSIIYSLSVVKDLTLDLMVVFSKVITLAKRKEHKECCIVLYFNRAYIIIISSYSWLIYIYTAGIKKFSLILVMPVSLS